MLGAATTFGRFVEYVGVPLGLVCCIGIAIEAVNRWRRKRSAAAFDRIMIAPMRRRAERRRRPF